MQSAPTLCDNIRRPQS